MKITGRTERLICPAHGVIEVSEFAIPSQLESNQLLISNTHGAEKHGTMEAFVHKHGNSRGAWDTERQMHTPGVGIGWNYPIVLGNMQVGIVEKVGPGCEGFQAGDRVVYFGGFAPVGIARIGSIWKLTANTDWKAATLLDPSCFALSALKDTTTTIGDSIGIFGLGAIGLCAIRLASMAGCFPIVAIDPVPKRRELAIKLGATTAIDPTGRDVGEELRQLTNWKGLDVILDYSGSVAALNSALRGVAFGGTIGCGAFPAPYAAGLDFGGEAHMNRPNIVFTRSESDPNRNHPRWSNPRVQETVHRMILDGAFDGAGIVDPIVKYNPTTLAKDYEMTMADKTSAVKMGLEY